MNPNNQEPIEDLFPFYAMGSLSPEERDQVERYLDENPEAREQVQEMTEAAAALAYSLEPVTPRNELAETLLNRIQSQPRELGRSLFGGLARNWASATIAIASLIIAAVSVTWAVARNAEILQLEAELVGLEATIAEQNLIISQLSLPGVEVIEVPGTEVGSDASGRLFADPEGSSGILFAWGLTPLSPEESYQVWLIASDNPVSAGILSVGDVGNAAQLIEARESLGLFDAIGISVEPFGGSDLPTGPIVLFASLSD